MDSLLLTKWPLLFHPFLCRPRKAVVHTDNRKQVYVSCAAVRLDLPLWENRVAKFWGDRNAPLLVRLQIVDASFKYTFAK